MQIFLSYGHDRFAPLAEKIKKDLEADGHTVWFDRKNLRGSYQWESEIEEGILASDWLILMMTDHSVRRPNGVCLDEVSKARFKNKSILPLMVQSVEPPFCITRVQWIDMMSTYFNGEGKLNREVYDVKIKEIRDIIDGIKDLGQEGEQVGLYNALSPLDNDVYYDNYRRDYYGREWLLDLYRKWVDGKDSSKVFIILGKAGTGKTAFVASLCSRQPEVAGIHFCKYNDSDRADPKRALMSLAYSMSTQIPEYADELRRIPDLNGIRNKSLNSVFQTLFTIPLSKIGDHPEKVLIIDALDEADVDGRNVLLDIISTEFEKTPRWLKLLMTSRPETDISAIVSKYHPLIVEEQKQNEDDVRGYAEKMLASVEIYDRKRAINALVKNSQGNFLYITQTVRDILNGNLDPNDIEGYPTGLTDIFRVNFNRLFSQNMTYYKENVRPFFEILVSEFEPMSADDIFDILGTDEYDREDIVRLISPLFPMKNGVVVPMHKSIYDWLIDKTVSGQYFVFQKKGHERLASYMDGLIGNGDITESVAKYAVKHNLMCGRTSRAVQLMNDMELQQRRFGLLGVDSTAYEYFRELETVHAQGADYSQSVMNSETFLWLFDTLRDHIMHMGMFQVLMNCGFDEIADKIAETGWYRMHIIGLYYYTTARTKRAMEYFERIVESMPPGNDDILSGTNDMLGLSYKKYIRFEESERCLRKSVEIAPNRRVGASSMVNLSKIYYHELRWEDAYKWVTDGIDELQRYIDSMEDMDEKESSIRFKSEFHRIKAEVAMWHADIDTCDECYRLSDGIHDMFEMNDQYQPRYEYTKMFISILKGEQIPETTYEKGLAMKCNTYDRERFKFYYGLYLYATGDESGALALFDECHRICLETDFIMECAELEAAMELCGRPACSYDNKYLTVWHDYTKTLFKDMRKRYSG